MAGESGHKVLETNIWKVHEVLALSLYHWANHVGIYPTGGAYVRRMELVVRAASHWRVCGTVINSQLCLPGKMPT